MKKIDELLIKAQRMVRGGMELSLAMVLPDGDSWAAMAHLWDGKLGRTATLNKPTWPTMEAAVEHIHAMSLEYPNSKDVPIIIDDLGG